MTTPAVLNPNNSVTRETVVVALDRNRAYDIIVGAGLIDSAGRHIRPFLKRPRTVIVSDTTVADLYLKRLESALAAEGISSSAVVLPPGEKTKSFGQLEYLASALLDAEVERSDKIIALGGGIIGDLVGFTASILRRGVDFIQMPTTLLSQVDSSVGGKTGINTKQGKNLVGTFHQPRLVLADTAALGTLPRRERLAGYAEVMKYGLLGDAPFFAWLEDNALAVLNGEDDALRHAVVVSCRAKAAIVVEDEREEGRRALLNLGHTFGHALEAETGYSNILLHGEGVALGMMLALDLSVRLGACHPDDAARVKRHLKLVGLPHSIGQLNQSITVDALVAHMKQDKKVQAGTMTFVLASAIGQAYLSREVPMDALRETLAASINDATKNDGVIT